MGSVQTRTTCSGSSLHTNHARPIGRALPFSQTKNTHETSSPMETENSTFSCFVGTSVKKGTLSVCVCVSVSVSRCIGLGCSASCLLLLPVHSLISPFPTPSDSPVHDHPNSHCFVKVLKGKITEEVYSNANPEQVSAHTFRTTSQTVLLTHLFLCFLLFQPEELKLLSSSTHSQNAVTYIHGTLVLFVFCRSVCIVLTSSSRFQSDKIGLHRMLNPSHTEPAYTLHVYCPPYSKCKVFDERTGIVKGSGQLKFYSSGGRIL